MGIVIGVLFGVGSAAVVGLSAVTVYLVRRLKTKMETLRQNMEARQEPEVVERRDFLIREVLNYRDQFNIGFIGASGVGKSSLINKIINKQEAETGIVETTNQIKSYKSNDEVLKDLTFWDCPGFGTQKFSFENNIKKILCFDFLFILIGKRIFETDIELLKFCIAKKIPLALVRSQSDQDVDSIIRNDTKYSKQYYFQLTNEEKKIVKQKCRQTCKEYLREQLRSYNVENAENIKYYYVSSQVLLSNDTKEENYPIFDDHKIIDETLKYIADNKPTLEESIMRRV